jgi:hypothetical protein
VTYHKESIRVSLLVFNSVEEDVLEEVSTKNFWVPMASIIEFPSLKVVEPRGHDLLYEYSTWFPLGLSSLWTCNMQVGVQ